MRFINDEVRHDYHKMPMLLQMLCQVLESSMAQAYYQLEVVDSFLNADDGISSAMLCVFAQKNDEDQVDADVINEICLDFNKRYRRKDGKVSCIIETEDANIITVVASEAAHLAQLP